MASKPIFCKLSFIGTQHPTQPPHLLTVNYGCFPHHHSSLVVMTETLRSTKPKMFTSASTLQKRFDDLCSNPLKQCY